ncbi:MAG: serine/threonine protein kinase [Desulfobulbus sp.]|jgi:Ser/Thr protein kinase RdoA (MazF antagonist)
MEQAFFGGSGCPAFQKLTPDSILEQVETALGVSCTNLCRSYASYVNRVFELEERTGRGLVVKFYRPGRWSVQALRDEHEFLAELAAEEIPVVAPLRLRDGSTLGQCDGLCFAVFPKAGGRCVDELDGAQWLALGRLLGRMHMVGARRAAQDRIRLHPDASTTAQVAFIRDSGLVPDDLIDTYLDLCAELIETIRPAFSATETIRIQGDCHGGNLIRRPDTPFVLIDFDDMAMGPPVQDFWMLLPGPLAESGEEVELLIEGYSMFRSFDRRSLSLIEPLRAMRFIHYSAWCAHQWLDDGQTNAVSDFATRSYWEGEINDLRDQLERIRAATGCEAPVPF